MVDIGLDADGAIEHLRRQLAIVEIIDKLDGQLSPDPYRLAEPGSELAALAETAPDAPVNLVLSVRAGLTAARGALDQIASLLGHNSPTDAIVLQALLRTALLGAGRVVFALAPADPGQRQRNVRVVLRQESRSLMQGLNAFAEFEHLASLKPHGGYLEEQRRKNKALQDGSQPAGEAMTLKEVARVSSWRRPASTTPPPLTCWPSTLCGSGMRTAAPLTVTPGRGCCLALPLWQATS